MSAVISAPRRNTLARDRVFIVAPIVFMRGLGEAALGRWHPRRRNGSRTALPFRPDGRQTGRTRTEAFLPISIHSITLIWGCSRQDSVAQRPLPAVSGIFGYRFNRHSPDERSMTRLASGGARTTP